MTKDGWIIVGDIHIKASAVTAFAKGDDSDGKVWLFVTLVGGDYWRYLPDVTVEEFGKLMDEALAHNTIRFAAWQPEFVANG